MAFFDDLDRIDELLEEVNRQVEDEEREDEDAALWRDEGSGEHGA